MESLGAMETLMADCVQSSLRLFMNRNAIFLCERLCAEFPSEVNLQLLATCYLRNNQAYCAYHILKGRKMAQSRYLFAIACFEMNLLREAEASLCPSNEQNAEVPNGAAGHYLLGLIYRFTDRSASAIDHFMQALTLDPLLWAAYEELCILGAAMEADECFCDSAAVRIQMLHLPELNSQSLLAGGEDHSVTSSRTIGPEEMSPRQLKQLHPSNHRDTFVYSHGGQPINNGLLNVPLYGTPSPVTTQLSRVVPPPPCKNVQQGLHTLGGDGSVRSAVNPAIQSPRRKFMDEGKLRKVSGRLFSDSALRRSTRLSGETTSSNSNASQVGGNGVNHSAAKFLGGFSTSSKMSSLNFRSVTVRKGQSWATENVDEGRRAEAFDDARIESTTASSSMSNLSEYKCHEHEKTNSQIGGVLSHGSKVVTGAAELLSLFRILGEGYRLSCTYRCQDAMEAYLKLPSHHYNTGWVLSQVGKAHFELVDYFEADRAFSLARCISPYTLEGLDIYSTVLFHLKEEMKLSYLAQELISTDRLSPQAWCAMGNCYSLQKDHETALKNFQRAVHLNPRFTYAHTLCGHEYVALEDFENGIKCYQSALQVDERHYNAWYGLGVVYLHQEKFQFAEHHFRRAFRINPRSSVLMCYLGMALHSLKKYEDALEMMEKAIVADVKNPLPMYQKANILASLERYDDALRVLEQLIEYTPRESSIYALMGKIYKRGNMHDKAMFYFGLALDLKPPAADFAAIKSAVEKLYLPDEMEDTL
uniref:Cell division cycle protein 27 B n=1 Tax=Anthurium amnicola TaxID=1678845 RepID=A0A1D1ZFP6_9ARAE